MRVLDLFCGAGGASAGYARAGAEVIGVDLAPMPHYPYAFVQADALAVLRGEVEGICPITFDLIHASPPCQRYSTMTKRWARSEAHPDLVDPTRELLRATGRPYVIENVVGAPLLDPITLCGSMFGLEAPYLGEWRQLRRHRVFETSFGLFAPQNCSHRGQAIGVYGHAGGRSKRDGIAFPGVGEWRIAMEIDWMTGDELAESIPPAYTEWIAKVWALDAPKGLGL